jgi:hypothetical protein
MLPSALAPHCVLALAPLLAAVPVPSDVRSPAEEAPGPYQLRFDTRRDGLVTGVGAAVHLSCELLFKEDLAPATCRWCDRVTDGTDRLNRLDRWCVLRTISITDSGQADQLAGTGAAMPLRGTRCTDAGAFVTSRE